MSASSRQNLRMPPLANTPLAIQNTSTAALNVVSAARVPCGSIESASQLPADAGNVTRPVMARAWGESAS